MTAKQRTGSTGDKRGVQHIRLESACAAEAGPGRWPPQSQIRRSSSGIPEHLLRETPDPVCRQRHRGGGWWRSCTTRRRLSWRRGLPRRCRPSTASKACRCGTSTKGLELEKLPESLLVIGGGIIGVELGQMFARAGVKVTICCRSRLLPDAEPEVSQALAEYLRQDGVTVCQGVRYQKIEQGQRHRAHLPDAGRGNRLSKPNRFWPRRAAGRTRRTSISKRLASI